MHAERLALQLDQELFGKGEGHAALKEGAVLGIGVVREAAEEPIGHFVLVFILPREAHVHVKPESLGILELARNEVVDALLDGRRLVCRHVRDGELIAVFAHSEFERCERHCVGGKKGSACFPSRKPFNFYITSNRAFVRERRKVSLL